eukprot:m.142875 g.142875  ORF g.142875 m.142875 type:complete len:171 (-) comp52625_c0_seq5:42-554(-)
MSTQSAVAGSAEPIQPTDSEIELRVYGGEQLLGEIMALISADLSEPYSIYTYRYFINNWPKLCFTAHCGSVCIGAIVCKLSHHKKGTYRGYIAMLAVHKDHRRKNIASRLVRQALLAMQQEDADEVVLEAEISNVSAIRLYEKLGFARDKRLFRYYMNGVDALRLKLWLK